MKLYDGIDLHSNNIYMCIINEQDEVVYEHLPVAMAYIAKVLDGYKQYIEYIAIESTYN